jgi:hypothetical protein
MLGLVKSISFNHERTSIAAVYFLSKDPVWGQPVSGNHLWLAIAFFKDNDPEVKFKLTQPLSLQNQPSEIIEVIVKREIRLYLKEDKLSANNMPAV